MPFKIACDEAPPRRSQPRHVGGLPVAEVLLIPFGHVEVDRPMSGEPFVFTRRQAVQWFTLMGRKLAIDYEHQSLADNRNDGLKPAAGWIGRLEVRGDGLWACEIEWTERATGLLSRGEYRYFSPVIYWAGNYGGDVGSLGPVALTNDPAMRRVPALAASRERNGARMHVTVCAARPVPRAGNQASRIGAC
ncbi:MAG: hypothetical protein KAY37_11930 [Phycisphaerae bacterium]|nr:hypothetical protein [Phycisphaerae bacterium]